MYDSIHVKVEVVGLEAIGVGLSEVERKGLTVDCDRSLLDGISHDFGILLDQPTEERRNTHRERRDEEEEKEG